MSRPKKVDRFNADDETIIEKAKEFEELHIAQRKGRTEKLQLKRSTLPASGINPEAMQDCIELKEKTPLAAAWYLYCFDRYRELTGLNAMVAPHMAEIERLMLPGSAK
jgi:hypothetical protein